MFDREFEYKGYDGQPHKDMWSFNLSEAELYEMELGNVGGVNGMINRLVREEQPDKIVTMFKTLILKAVGRRSADGSRFMKKEQIGMPWGEYAEEFRETPAYSQLFIELVSSAEKLTEFLLKAIPEEVAARINSANASEEKPAEPSDNILPFTTPIVESGEPDAP